MPVTNAQNAEMGHRVLIAAVHPDTGRQIVNMLPMAIVPPLIELRCAGEGFPWHDASGTVWESVDVDGKTYWGHSKLDYWIRK